ncbi:hypothetical protein TVAG_119940 [Trichomonas vaginalis G3]|uniref:Uncharacterized protein n=1 Tax=Trichomonas vaginalis (strain ATCC PRA-98 / G3) TaxID=412133 RepID=A2D7E0_TRIV3|nr:hypothetical protein TVAGG3_0992830 [Trichomonas vaginalis G3]EAY23657.1 hypothetical protein TVAG_119940 [Trichomonas vaginalis G3]KAI5490149.1 hypothetical protein TVAGG3_0992830 [Trichomonas vaginalis G3]|eukprot:XP_001276905.1 hypothetical protein [Trichomonas vaginalis G3]
MARKCTSIEEVLEYVLDTHVLQSVLSQDVLNGKIPLIYKQVNKLTKTSPLGYENDVYVSLTNEQKVQIINQFAKNKQFSDEEKEVLTSIVDWTQEGSDSFLINYHCEWVSLKIARQKLRSIIFKRKNALAELGKLSSQEKKNFQNIPMLFYISKMYQAENIDLAEEVNIYDQATTLCHLTNRLTPKDFSIINLSTTGLVLSSVDCLFDDDNSYLRILNEEQECSVEIKTRFYVEPHKIDIFCDPKRDHSFYTKLVGTAYKYLPEIELSTYCDDELVSKQIAKFSSSVLKDFEIEAKSKGINRIVLKALDSKLPQALRIRYINLKGVFVL